MSVFLGIARERVYSPNKVEDDQAILDAVARHLGSRHEVRTITADDELPGPPSDTVVFTMCQGPDALQTIRGWENAGIRVINTAAAIENCHRRRMLAAFEHAGVQCPPGVLVSTAGEPAASEWVADGAWLKRGDVHATQEGDVVFVRQTAEMRAVLDNFRRRDIGSALLQRHVEGVVIKFYAVRGTFFSWFPESPLELAEEEVAVMRILAEGGAAALELEVFGGDFVRAENGTFWLIDLNDWPSYGRCRPAAAAAIAEYLDKEAGCETPGRGKSQ